MKASLNKIYVSVAAIMNLLTMNNCDNVKLSVTTKVQSMSSKGQVCAAPPKAFQALTKIMFLVDISGSNFGDGNSAIVNTSDERAGTDPDKSYRYGTIKNFVDAHANTEQVSWGMIVFGNIPSLSSDGAEALINNGDLGTATFSAKAADMYSALGRFQTRDDNGSTPYHAALEMAANAITADKASITAGDSVNYSVVLLSDGQPTDAQYMTAGSLDQTKIEADVKKLVSAGASLTTVYYGGGSAIDPAAAARLQDMAQVGNGKFVNTNISGRQVPLDSVIAVKAAVPWIIKKFLVANLNAAPCDDGTMGVDTDADGICDKDELTYNQAWMSNPAYQAFAKRMGGKVFDPKNRNSFDKNYNDLFYLQHITQNTLIDSNCSAFADDAHDLLNTCEKALISSTSPSGPTPTWTNRMGSTADPKNMDSDGDGFIDWLEVEFERNLSPALDFNNISRSAGGYRMDEIISQHRNPRNPSSSIAYDGQFLSSGVNADGQNCYSYNQTVLPLYATQKVTVDQVSGIPELAHEADENVILIYFIQTPQNDPNGPGELHYRFQKVKVGSAQLNLDFSFESYQTYIANTSRAAGATK